MEILSKSHLLLSVIANWPFAKNKKGLELTSDEKCFLKFVSMDILLVLRVMLGVIKKLECYVLFIMNVFDISVSKVFCCTFCLIISPKQTYCLTIT